MSYTLVKLNLSLGVIKIAGCDKIALSFSYTIANCSLFGCIIFFSRYLINDPNLKYALNIEFVFGFLLQILSENFSFEEEFSEVLS